MAASKQQAAGSRQRAIRLAAGSGDPRRARSRDAGRARTQGIAVRLSPLSPLHSAFTLIEMLVVISILVMLAAITVPNIRPALETRRVREAARAVEAYLNRARVDAIDRGLPVGVEFVRANQPEACVLLRQVVSQPIYTGEDESSAVFVQQDTPQTTPPTKVLVSPNGTFNLATNDHIQFGNRTWNPAAPTYRITGPGAGSQWKATLINPGPDLPWPTGSWSYGQPFAVYRQPTPSSPVGGAAGPLQLPESLCIDLYDSGTDTVPFPTSTTSVIVLFGPNGSVQQILPDALGIFAADRLYFLLGRRDRLPGEVKTPRDPPQHEDGLRNWEDLNNLWVSIVPRTGMTVTTENAAYSKPASFDYSIWNQRKVALQAARGIAQTAQTMGGR